MGQSANLFLQSLFKIHILSNHVNQWKTTIIEQHVLHFPEMSGKLTKLKNIHEMRYATLETGIEFLWKEERSIWLPIHVCSPITDWMCAHDAKYELHFQTRFRTSLKAVIRVVTFRPCECIYYEKMSLETFEIPLLEFFNFFFFPCFRKSYIILAFSVLLFKMLLQQVFLDIS